MGLNRAGIITMNAIGKEKSKRNYTTMQLFYSLGTYNKLKRLKNIEDLKKYLRWVAYRIAEETSNPDFRSELEHLVSLCESHAGVQISRDAIKKQFVSVWNRMTFRRPK